VHATFPLPASFFPSNFWQTGVWNISVAKFFFPSNFLQAGARNVCVANCWEAHFQVRLETHSQKYSHGRVYLDKWRELASSRNLSSLATRPGTDFPEFLPGSTTATAF
jgi:hypothetical protein